MDSNFWTECAAHSIVIVPFKAYTGYRDGNLSEEDYIGVRFGWMQGDLSTPLASAEFYIAIEDCCTRLEDTADTPEGALLLWKAKHRG